LIGARKKRSSEGIVDANRWKRIRSLLEAARELPAGERAAFLAKECGDDEELRLEVESLLAAGRGQGP
jgi:hypothetical protein